MKLQNLIIGFAAALVISVLSRKFKFLKLSGSIAQFFLAGLIFGLGGIKWTVPILTFFLTSSILSKLRIRKNKSVDNFFEKSDERDYLQVFANGGLGGILVIISQFYRPELLFAVYVSSLSAVCSDTWATEIGTLKQQMPVNILSFKRVEQGTSGGISVMGTFSALMGAFIIPLSSLSWISTNLFYFILCVTSAGFLGSLLDSILGASVQAQYKCNKCNKITEKKSHCGKETSLSRGFSWINNDAVNFAASLSGCFFFILFNVWLKV